MNSAAWGKLAALRAELCGLGSAAIAFSGGVDSTFLLRVAKEGLGGRVVAVTARSRSFPARELEAAAAFCRAEGVEHVVLDCEDLDIPGYRTGSMNEPLLSASGPAGHATTRTP